MEESRSKEEQLVTLGRAIALIEKGWTKGAYARDAENVNVDENDPSACSWCIQGALYRAGAGTEMQEAVESAVETLTGAEYIHVFNDAPERTKEEVLELLRGVRERVANGET